MNIKEIAEIKRRFRAEKSNIVRIRGCLVNEKKEIISCFDQSLALMSLEESEEILALLRKTLSGAPGRNLIDLSFTNAQVLDSEEHRLLSTLRASALADDEAVNTLIDRIRASHQSEGNYVILLAADSYDVPAYGTDGHKKEDTANLYTYILCAVCPIKMTKSALGYRITENSLRNVTPDWLVSPPEIGFLFPAFDGRTANIYNTLFYTKDVADNHEALIASLFHSEAPMPAAEQKESFRTILRDTLGEDCSIEVVKTVQEQFTGLITEHKASKEPDTLLVTRDTIGEVLRTCQVDEEHIERLEQRFDEAFGKRAALPPENIVDTRQLEVRTPETSIRLPAEMSDLVETRIIDGQKYILIRVDSTVEVNGIEIHIE